MSRERRDRGRLIAARLVAARLVAARLVAALALVLVAGCHTRTGPQPAPPAPNADAAAEQQITAAVLAAPIRFLADDLLEGRGPGTEGDRRARAYIASMMEWIGLQPGGPGGSWEQPFELVGVKTIAPEHWTFASSTRSARFENGTDFVAVSGVEKDHAELNGAEVVFAGYAIQAPEYQWDDFKTVDLRGKVLLVLNNDPDWDPQLFAGSRRLYYGRWTYKYESAARQGAVGAIIVHTTESAGYPWQTVQTSWRGENSRLPGTPAQPLQIQAWMTEAAAARLVALSGRTLSDLTAAARKRDFVPVALGVTTSLRVRSEIRRYQTANVLGVLSGRDPALRDQYLVVTAHHDHLGRVERDGQVIIYNGALDNASGVAQLLAIARAFRALPNAPRRSLLFLAVGAEEQGLLGSAYFAANPTIQPGRMVANLNFDGGNIWGRTHDIAAVGYGKSTLDRYASEAAARQGRVYVDEPFPERGHFYRSDQFNFAKIGVPALFLDTGLQFVGRPEGWGREQMDAWVAQHYHQPSDDFDSTWNLDGMVEDTRLAFAIAVALAESSDLPAWVPGDEFEAARKRALAEIANGNPSAGGNQ